MCIGALSLTASSEFFWLGNTYHNMLLDARDNASQRKVLPFLTHLIEFKVITSVKFDHNVTVLFVEIIIIFLTGTILCEWFFCRECFAKVIAKLLTLQMLFSFIGFEEKHIFGHSTQVYWIRQLCTNTLVSDLPPITPSFHVITPSIYHLSILPSITPCHLFKVSNYDYFHVIVVTSSQPVGSQKLVGEPSNSIFYKLLSLYMRSAGQKDMIELS